MTTRPLLVAACAVFVLAVVLTAPRADAKTHSCGAGQTWSLSQGACVKAKAAAPRSPQKAYDDAVADLTGNAAHPDPARGLATLTQNCERASHGPSCTLLGFLYSRGRAVEADPVRAMQLFVKACGGGDVDGCFNVGDFAERVGLYAEARTAFAHACDIGSGLACSRGGDLYRGTQGDTKADPATARKLYKASYTLVSPLCPGDGGACYIAGFLYENGYGIDKNATAALTAYRQGCTAGSGEACVALGAALDSGLGGTADATGANAAYLTACEEDDNANACQKISERLAKANQDLPHAFQMAKRACDLDAQNCGTVGELYRLGLGTPADQAAATKQFKAGCDAGAPRWCTSYAQRAHEGLGMATDVALGVTVAAKACDDGDEEGCRAAAGYLAVSDPARASTLATKGCNQNDAPSCDLAGNYAVVAKHADVAGPLYDKACDGNAAQGCLDAATLYAADPVKVMDRTQKACIIGDAQLSGGACEDLVRLTYFGTPKNAETAMYAAARACALGRTDSCGWLVQLAGEVPGDHADLREYLDTSCKGGNTGSCGAQANLMLRGTEADKQAALALLDATCARKVDSACLAKADALYAGLGSMPQPDKAEAIYDEYCGKGNAAACSNMAIIQNGKKAYEKAVTYAKRACDAGSPDGCNSIGYFYFTAKGVRWDATEGVKAWQKACELGSGYGCSNMGYMYRYGVVVPKDGKKAFEAYTKSCTPTEQIGCQGAAHFYETGDGGTTVDAKKAADAYRSACESTIDPVPLACSELAAMLERTHGGTAPEISRLRQKAIDIAKDKAPTNPYSAWMLGTYYRDGVATVADPAKARTWFAKACEEYDPLGCLDAGKAFLATGSPADAALARGQYLERACSVGLTEGCDLKAGGTGGKGTTPGAGVKAKGCGCQGGGDGGSLLMLGVAALVLRRRRR